MECVHFFANPDQKALVHGGGGGHCGRHNKGLDG
ncbi:hypothetical protein PH7735_02091 [Shimia thalassica]|uniref:Uncharacterized protein n=1 Tax=Shimia thalassica TaxID=1715693 RepID=A0A0P1I8Z2_9RHOB|nr:hypothetical protein PH7735_02091 [Shimia thalassica]